MATTVKSTSINTTDPGYATNRTTVTKTTTTNGAGDTVTVNAAEAGNNPGLNAVAVFKVNSNGKSTVTVDKGNVVITGTGSGTDMYLSVVLNQTDPDNWTVNVNTSGGSTYNFVKGSGGGGHQRK